MRLRTLLHYALGAAATLVLAPPVMVLSVAGRREAAYRPVRVWARLLLLATGVRMRVEGVENVPPSSYVAIASHCSHLDGPVILLAVSDPVYFVIKRELARVPLWGQAVVSLGFVAVDRSDSQRARAQMRRAVSAVRSGQRILVFAEGTRSPDGRLQPFRKGGFHLAVDAQVPILPVAVNGSWRLFAKGADAVTPGEVVVTIGEPIPTGGLAAIDVDELVARTRAAIAGLRSRDPDFARSCREALTPAVVPGS